MSNPMQSLATARHLLTIAIERQDVALMVSLCGVIKKLVLTNRNIGLASGTLFESAAMEKFISSTISEIGKHLGDNGYSEEQTGDLVANQINKFLETQRNEN